MFKEYSDLINVDELCEVLAIGKNTAYDILSKGQIKAFKTWRI